MISCLMCTYGRWRRVCEAVSMFLAQDYEDKELIIYNSHSVPLVGDFPNVLIVNEPGDAQLGFNRNRALSFARGELCRTWDDDDLYLPHTLRQGVDHIGDHDAWKPSRSWCIFHDSDPFLARNFLESSVTWKTEFVRRIGYGLGQGDEQMQLFKALPNRVPPEQDMGLDASFCYRWGIHVHASQKITAAEWRAKNNDHGNGRSLRIVDMSPWFDLIHEAKKNPLVELTSGVFKRGL